MLYSALPKAWNCHGEAARHRSVDLACCEYGRCVLCSHLCVFTYESLKVGSVSHVTLLLALTIFLMS